MWTSLVRKAELYHEAINSAMDAYILQPMSASVADHVSTCPAISCNIFRSQSTYCNGNITAFDTNHTNVCHLTDTNSEWFPLKLKCTVEEKCLLYGSETWSMKVEYWVKLEEQKWNDHMEIWIFYERNKNCRVERTAGTGSSQSGVSRWTDDA